MRCITRVHQVGAVICCQGPVVMLTGTIDTCKWLLVKKACQPVALCHFLHSLHNDLVVVYGLVYTFIDRCQLMLCRSHFIMLCFCRNT